MLTQTSYMDGREKDLKHSGVAKREMLKVTLKSAFRFSLCNSAKSIHPSVGAVRSN